MCKYTSVNRFFVSFIFSPTQTDPVDEVRFTFQEVALSGCTLKADEVVPTCYVGLT